MKHLPPEQLDPASDAGVHGKPEPHAAWVKKKLEKSAIDTQPRVSHEQVMNEAQAIIDRKKADPA